MQVELCRKEDCTGCFACMQTCKQGAIHSVLSREGFLYPVIDYEKCVSCSSCVIACPVLSLQPPYNYNENSPCISAYQKELTVRKRSSSGGLFYTLANSVIEQGGVVYGAAWTYGLYLKHIEAEDEKTLEKLLRSKYVQSDTSDVYIQVKRRLNEGRKVLFCGTPCQVAAIKTFLKGKEYENLILVDVICQGVPSPAVFRKYIEELEAKYKSKVVDVTFRSKKYGWRSGLLFLEILLDNGSRMEIKYKKNYYYRSFHHNFFIRESCFNCQFKSTGKGCFSDITLADFWRIGTKIPYKCDSYESGVSAVMTNTTKGKQVFENIKKDIIWEERTFEEFATNDGLRRARKPIKWHEAFNVLENSSFKRVQSLFYPYSIRQFISNWIDLHFSQRIIYKIKKWLKK